MTVEELERYGVRVSAIAPIARTRLTLATPGMGALMDEPEDRELDLFSPATSRCHLGAGRLVRHRHH